MESKLLGTKAIIEGITCIAKVSAYKPKYDHLLGKLQKFGLLNGDLTYTGVNPGLDIVYIQPSNKEGKPNIIDFIQIADWLDKTYTSTEFEIEFAKALRVWSND
ncbi:MAG: hypothetical protein AB9842_07465 [Bacteroidales bacterium]